jgi:hypothetical protein
MQLLSKNQDTTCNIGYKTNIADLHKCPNKKSHLIQIQNSILIIMFLNVIAFYLWLSWVQIIQHFPI